MSVLLLDTDVIIDLLRNDILAHQWFASLQTPPALSSMAMLEVMQGCRDKREHQQARQLMNRFLIVYPVLEDIERALFTFSPLCLSHGIGAMDLLIAATAIGHNMTLVSKNLKHFKHVPGLSVVRPY